ncbi:hypothetical protein AMTRI_Chr12g235530 [Amborella trichopoda]
MGAPMHISSTLSCLYFTKPIVQRWPTPSSPWLSSLSPSSFTHLHTRSSPWLEPCYLDGSLIIPSDSSTALELHIHHCTYAFVHHGLHFREPTSLSPPPSIIHFREPTSLSPPPSIIQKYK